ncbi:MAG TPA: hypothetical protein VGB68_12985 [Pyrinomonadaceae bacterium]|jgi:hypothetical protein
MANERDEPTTNENNGENQSSERPILTNLLPEKGILYFNITR